MKIILYASSFNGLTQRVFDELRLKKHSVEVCLASHEDDFRTTLQEFNPDLIICPFLKQKIPDDIWKNNICIIIHPGIPGDRGPSSIEWAQYRHDAYWGVTALQADEEMDAGDIWSSRVFPMRDTEKACLYRNEVTEAAVQCTFEVVEKARVKGFIPRKLDYRAPDIKGTWNDPMRQGDRKIDWENDSTDTVLLKLKAADSFPGVRDNLCGIDVNLFNACREETLRGSQPKQILAKHQGAICLSTKDGAVWVGHLKKTKDTNGSYIKLPATWVLENRINHVPERDLPLYLAPDVQTFHEIRVETLGRVSYIHFHFHNGAMGKDQSKRLLKVYQEVCSWDIDTIVLMGGRNFWSNGIHLNHIEHSPDPVQESCESIVAIDNVVEAILKNTSQVTVAALGANAGAGGAMLAIACDHVIMREGVILNPHYKSMGLCGSEFWTYSLPKRVGSEMAQQLTQACLPVGAHYSHTIGLVDDIVPECRTSYRENLSQKIASLCPKTILQKKKETLASLPQLLEEYRSEELRQIEECFRSEAYKRARKSFVYKTSCPQKPAHLTHLSRKLGQEHERQKVKLYVPSLLHHLQS